MNVEYLLHKRRHRGEMRRWFQFNGDNKAAVGNTDEEPEAGKWKPGGRKVF